jgi:RNA polymerase sigma-70 factor (ECF subfamily)
LTNTGTTSGGSSGSSATPARVGVSREEFAELFRAQSPALKIVAAAILGSPRDAEDVVQEAAAIALTKTRELSEVRSFPAWMTQIVRYVALNARRGEKRRRVTATGAVPVEGRAAPKPVEAALDSKGSLREGQASFDDRAVRALMTLSETARACLLLRVVLDMPYKEIARVLSIPEGAAMTHVSRARAAMVERLTIDAMPGASEGAADA